MSNFSLTRRGKLNELPDISMKPVRPSALQEIIRQWILLIPLTTAVVGSASIFAGPDDEWVDYLPPIFFIGALLVTAAMLHQRRMFYVNLALTERLQSTNHRLDILHRLALELNKSLDVVQVAQTVIEYSLRSLHAEAGAIWLRIGLLPAGTFEPGLLRSLPLKSSADPSRRNWVCVASTGFDMPIHREILEAWDAMLERGEYQGDQQLFRIQTEDGADAPEDSELWHRILGDHNSAASVPIIWEGEIVGTFVLANWQEKLQKDDTVLLHDIALVAGPSLQNSLLYGAATARAEIDGLTNLYNHRVIHERLNQEISRVQRARETSAKAKMSVAIMDVTDFKLFNDTYGHAMGDKVLRIISDSLRATFRASDAVGRYGGDEFVVLLPDTHSVGAEVICSRAVQMVNSRPFEAADGSRIAIRLAAGVATFPDDGETGTELLRSADARLYEAKGRGRLMLDSANGVETETVQVKEPMWQSLGLLDALVAAIDSKDHYTRRHCETVWKYASLLAQEMELTRDQVQAIHVGSLAHDVGKIVVPDAILRKPGRLSPEESQIMQQHTVFGSLIVKDVPHLEMVLGAVRHHHERYDGSGYPDSLRGEEIPFMGRFLAVPDSFVAMITDRPYRKALTPEQALTEIEQGIGQQFDPTIVEPFIRVMRRQTSSQESSLIDLATASSRAASRVAPANPTG